jgi:preprotein translocase subunit YajC
LEQYGSIVFLVGFMALFWFLIIRPQQKQQKQRQAMLSALKKGDSIITIGGLHGQIVELTDDTVVLQVADKVQVTFNRSAIANVKTKD